jgi:plastocyanin
LEDGMKKMFSILVLVLVLGAVVALVGCSAAPPASAPAATPPASTGGSTSAPAAGGTTEVSIANFAFAPADLTVKAGDTVKWTNNDSVAHTITSDSGAFESGNLDPGASYSFTFKAPGAFAYHCGVHPSMTAKITVQ